MIVKTHKGIVVKQGVEIPVKLHQTLENWVVGTSRRTESYSKKNGFRTGGNTNSKLILSSVKPLEDK